jgi:hypothetical protein
MSDGSELFNYVGGGAGLVAAVVWVVQKLGARVVEREDADKKALLARQEESAKTERSIEKTLFGLERDVAGLRSDLANVGRQVESRAIAQDKEISELRSEMKEQLEALEHRLKQDMQRIVSAGADHPVSGGRGPRRSRT